MSSRYGLEIRAANAGDALGLTNLLAMPSGLTVALAERLDTSRHSHSAVLVAVEWGPPSGVVVLHWYPTLQATLPTAQITTLMVALDARRRGIGRALLKAAAQSARQAGCGELQLLAQTLEPSLAAFCQATGFVETGVSFVRPLRKKN